jgi:hypothetical protein
MRVRQVVLAKTSHLSQSFDAFQFLSAAFGDITEHGRAAPCGMGLNVVLSGELFDSLHHQVMQLNLRSWLAGGNRMDFEISVPHRMPIERHAGDIWLGRFSGWLTAFPRQLLPWSSKGYSTDHSIIPSNYRTRIYCDSINTCQYCNMNYSYCGMMVFPFDKDRVTGYHLAIGSSTI